MPPVKKTPVQKKPVQNKKKKKKKNPSPNKQVGRFPFPLPPRPMKKATKKKDRDGERIYTSYVTACMSRTPTKRRNASLGNSSTVFQRELYKVFLDARQFLLKQTVYLLYGNDSEEMKELGQSNHCEWVDVDTGWLDLDEQDPIFMQNIQSLWGLGSTLPCACHAYECIFGWYMLTGMNVELVDPSIFCYYAFEVEKEQTLTANQRFHLCMLQLCIAILKALKPDPIEYTPEQAARAFPPLSFVPSRKDWCMWQNKPSADFALLQTLEQAQRMYSQHCEHRSLWLSFCEDMETDVPCFAIAANFPFLMEWWPKQPLPHTPNLPPQAVSYLHLRHQHISDGLLRLWIPGHEHEPGRTDCECTGIGCAACHDLSDDESDTPTVVAKKVR
jgi:hypothetical protein